MKPKIAIVNSSSFGKVFTEHWEELESFSELTQITLPPTAAAEEIVFALSSFHGIIASTSPHYSSEVLEKLPNLVVITRHGIGYNNIDVESASYQGVLVTKVEGIVERASVAELSVALLLSLARHIVAGSTAVREGRWVDRAQFVGLELSGKKIGLLGVGNIGSRVAEILAKGFQAKVSAYDPEVTNDIIQSLGAIPSDFDTIIEESDVIVLQCSLNKENYHYINHAACARVKKGALLINAARGELIDEAAVIEALQQGTLGGYAADVVENEPIDAEHPLLQAPNVLILPHLGGYGNESLKGMGATMVRNMREVFVDKAIPRNTINDTLNEKGIKKWA